MKKDSKTGKTTKTAKSPNIKFISDFLIGEGFTRESVEHWLNSNYSPEFERIYRLKNGDLIHLNFVGFGIKQFPNDLLNHFSKLEQFSIREYDVAKLPSDSFASNTQLKILSIENTKISGVPVAVFDPLMNLTNLRLYRNQIQSINHSLFDRLEKLEYLSLNEPNLKTLPEDVFDTLPNLRSLSLKDSGVQQLPDSLYRLKLKHLDLRGTPVSHVLKYDAILANFKQYQEFDEYPTISISDPNQSFI